MELLARLTHTPIKEHRTSTNSTLDDNPITFPLDQNFYVDATHEVVIVNVLTTLNLTSLWDGGKLTPYEMNKNRRFITSRIAPFATNVQFQRTSSIFSPILCVLVLIDGRIIFHYSPLLPSAPKPLASFHPTTTHHSQRCTRLVCRCPRMPRGHDRGAVPRRNVCQGAARNARER